MYKFQQISYEIKKKLNIFCVRHFNVLAHVISVIMLLYTTQYREICYVVNRSWHTAVCVSRNITVPPRPANTSLNNNEQLYNSATTVTLHDSGPVNMN